MRTLMVVLAGNDPISTREFLMRLHDRARLNHAGATLTFDEGQLLPLGRAVVSLEREGHEPVTIQIVSVLYGSPQHHALMYDQGTAEFEVRALTRADLVMYYLDPEDIEGGIEHLDALLSTTDNSVATQHVLAVTPQPMSENLSLRRVLAGHHTTVQLCGEGPGMEAKLMRELVERHGEVGEVNTGGGQRTVEVERGEEATTDEMEQTPAANDVPFWRRPAAVVSAAAITLTFLAFFGPVHDIVFGTGEEGSLIADLFRYSQIGEGLENRKLDNKYMNIVAVAGGAASFSKGSDVLVERNDEMGSHFDFRDGSAAIQIQRDTTASNEFYESSMAFGLGYSTIVLGTRYHIERSPADVYQVSVIEGAVLVTGPHCTGHMILEGQNWELRDTVGQPCGLIQKTANDSFEPAAPVDVDALTPAPPEPGEEPSFEWKLHSRLNAIKNSAERVYAESENATLDQKIQSMREVVDRGTASRVCHTSNKCLKDLDRAYETLHSLLRDKPAQQRALRQLYRDNFPDRNKL